MKRNYQLTTSWFVAVCLAICFPANSVMAQDKDEPLILTVAILPFETEDGEKDVVSDLLTVHLSNAENVLLVEREELGKILEEESLSLSGLVRADQAVRVGQLTGAKILITGSVMEAGGKRYLIAKLMSTETSRVIGASANGAGDAAMDGLTEELADDIKKIISEKANQMVAKPVTREDLLAILQDFVREHVKDDSKPLPTIGIDVPERHVGGQSIDPAAATEIAWYLTSLGFTVFEGDRRATADVVISGEGVSEFAARHGNLLSIKARLELKAVNRADSVLIVADRQTGVAVDLAENIAGKTALQDSAARIMQRIVPAIITWHVEK